MAAGSRYEHSHQELSANLAFMSREMFPLPALSRLGQFTHADRHARKCSHRDSPAIVVSLMSIPYRGKELDEERWHPERSTDGKWALPFLGQRWPRPAQARESIDSQLGSANKGLIEKSGQTRGKGGVYQRRHLSTRARPGSPRSTRLHLPAVWLCGARNRAPCVHAGCTFWQERCKATRQLG